MRPLLVILLLSISQIAFGQFQRIINASFDVEEASMIKVDLTGEVSYQEWEGTFILVETKVVIENCNENIFRSLMKSGRYKTKFEINGDVVSVSSNPALKRMIKSSLGQSTEEIFFKIYFPEGFKDHLGHPLQSSIEYSVEPGQ